MKSLFKASLLATTLALAFTAPQVMAAETTAKAPTSSAFKSDDQKYAYALGASLGRYMQNSLEEQKAIGVNLDKAQLLAGVQDALSDQAEITKLRGGSNKADAGMKMSEVEVEETLREFEGKVKQAAEKKMKAEAEAQEKAGADFRANFAKEKGVVKTKSGLLYQVEKEGTGAAPKATDTVVVNYKGTLVDGTEFDNSYKRGEPLTIPLNGVIKGWTEGLVNVKKGGKIKLVIPADLAYGENGVPGIPANSTLVFDVELLDIKPEAK